MRLLLFLTYYFVTPFSAALIAKELLPDFPEVEANIVLMWTFICLVSIPALLMVVTYGALEAKRRLAHPLNRLHQRAERQAVAPLSATSSEEHRKTARRISQIN